MKRQIFDEIANENQINYKSRKTNHSYSIEVKHYFVDEKSSQTIESSEGEYYIINSPLMHIYGNVCYEYTQSILKKNLLKLFKKLKFNSKKKVFIVGLGNDRLLSDSLGDRVTDKVLKSSGLKNYSKKICNVCGICPSIYANTGIPTFDIIDAVSKSVKPDLIVVIDSLATSDISRLGASFQMTTSSMKPGGAINNESKVLSKQTLGCQCVFIGVPLIYQMIIGGEKHMFAPKDIDVQVRKCAKIISNSLNEIFFPNLSKSEIDDLLY